MTKDIVEKIREQYSIGAFVIINIGANAIVNYDKSKKILGKIKAIKWVEGEKSCKIEFIVEHQHFTFIVDIYDIKMLDNFCTILTSKEELVNYYLEQGYKKDSFVTLKSDTSTLFLIQDILYIENCKLTSWNNLYVLTSINSEKCLNVKIPNEKLLVLMPIDNCELDTSYFISATSLFEN